MLTGAKLAIGALLAGVTLLLTKRARAAQLDHPRIRVVKAAASQLGVQNPDKYWSLVQPGLVGTKSAWCGGFALWALKQAGLAPNTPWQIGKGFTEINGLPRTKNPLPGDIAYFDQPYQHHAIVTSNDGLNVNTIDGNQAGNTVAVKTRPLSAATAYYSIQPFIG
ncbi:MAG TPA: CHAP domain-containing protein [Nitrospiraceae bacterium]